MWSSEDPHMSHFVLCIWLEDQERLQKVTPEVCRNKPAQWHTLFQRVFLQPELSPLAGADCKEVQYSCLQWREKKVGK